MGSVKLKRGTAKCRPFLCFFDTRGVFLALFCKKMQVILQVFQALDGKNVWVIK